MAPANIKIVGVLNITPDSFSDGGEFLEPEQAISQYQKLLAAGANFIEIGGDASGPNSKCVGSKIELQRLQPLLAGITDKSKIIVDTHNLSVAQLALESGVGWVNDISAGCNQEILKAVHSANAGIILMHASSKPHDFSHLELESPPQQIFSQIKSGLSNAIERALQNGISKDKIILDPGMGSFLSSDPNVSWYLIEHFLELYKIHPNLMLGVSRKGFLKGAEEQKISDRDLVSAAIGATLSGLISTEHQLFLRVHNPQMQIRALDEICKDRLFKAKAIER